MKYRAEIDGLRALAVVPVILFHAGFELFGGGFVGVDVFFVISGYLITTILINDIENKQFSLIGFYERRSRRILPALFFVMLVCIPFAWILMIPSQMKDFSESLIAVSLFGSNILFMSESGYFDTAVEEKPLLHTWSLAVEEQYYVVFPVFLFFAWRYGKNRVFWLIVALAAVSLLVSEWGWRNKPTANFYLAPTRAWELFAGSIAAFLVQKKGVQKNNFLALLGLVAILFAIFVYDETTPFPSVYALVPVLGVVLIIMFASTDTFTARILSTKTFVGIGLISYSAYLWHQPLFAFAKLNDSQGFSTELALVLCVLSMILAYFSWAFIEKPTRNKAIFSQRGVFTFSAAGIAFFVAVGAIGHRTNGFQSFMLELKYSAEDRAEVAKVFEAIEYDMSNEMAIIDCRLWAKNPEFLNAQKIQECHARHGKAIVVLGDSHAMNLFNIISRSQTYPFVIGVSQGGCRPHNDKDRCQYREFDKFIKTNKSILNAVLYHQSGSYFIEDTNGKVDSQNAFTGSFAAYEKGNILKVIDYLDALSENEEFVTVWVGPFLEYRWEPEDMLFSEELYSVNPNSVEIFEKLEEEIASEITSEHDFVYRRYNTLFFEPKESFVNDCFMFRDRDHYSKCGEAIIADKLAPQFLDALIERER